MLSSNEIKKRETLEWIPVLKTKKKFFHFSFQVLILCRVSSNLSAIQRSDRACSWDIAPWRWQSLWMHFPPRLSQSFWEYQCFGRRAGELLTNSACTELTFQSTVFLVHTRPALETCDPRSSRGKVWSVRGGRLSPKTAMHFLEAFWGRDPGICLHEPAPCNCSCYSENKVQNTAAMQ